ncbi:MAG TPA: YCF48-related protein [Acidimicrobiales bacterium]|nr:YCF48-related protein [Acidimicrobiales bacterium]
MDRYQKVLDILDSAIGGPGVNIGIHRAFWRGLSRDELVAKKVFGLDVFTVGQGADSNLVKALRGEAPFGSDLPNPPAGAQFSRMPAGLPPVPAADIAFIEQWVDDGCPAGETEPRPGTGPQAEPGQEPGQATDPGSVADLTWRRTSAPDAGSRHDDVFFLGPDLGWAVNSDGKILRTNDGGRTWTVQFTTEGLYLRCVGFASETHGWVGTLSPEVRLLATTDGGANWRPVGGLPEDGPSRVCGLSVVDESIVYASGTNYPFPAWGDRPPRMMRTLDGGASWQGWDMSDHASNLIDTYFTSSDSGWVVGGIADPSAEPGTGHRSDNLRAVVLKTEDGGRTWTNKAEALMPELPLGEWAWKIHFVDDRLGYVALESMELGAILKTVDAGESWERLPVNDAQGNKNLEGIGFVDEHTGWVGGWGDADFVGGFSSATLDGGRSWTDANHIGRFINRFRFIGNPVQVGYAAGLSIYKYSDEPVPGAAERAPTPAPVLLDEREPVEIAPPLRLQVSVPAGASRFVVNIWERFGELVRHLVDETSPDAGPKTVEWDLTDDDGRPLEPGRFIVRVTVDGQSESRLLRMAHARSDGSV